MSDLSPAEASMTAIPGEFRVGRVVARFFEAFKTHALVLFGLAFLLSALPSAFASWVGVQMQSGENVNPLDSIFGLSFGVIGTGAMTFAAMEGMKGRSVAFRTSLGKGISNWSGILGVSFLAGIGMVLGLIVLIVPGVFLMIAWSVAAPARLDAGPGVTAALTRSFNLTKGFRLKILLLLFFAFLAFFLILAVAAGIGAVTFGMESVGWEILIALLTGLTLPLLTTVGSASMYHELIMAKEGIGAEPIASIFD